MTMNRFWKRVFGILLSVAVFLSAAGFAVYAESANGSDSSEESGEVVNQAGDDAAEPEVLSQSDGASDEILSDSDGASGEERTRHLQTHRTEKTQT